jgi:tRNA (guanosine-2'-O-)-methyltransferase
MVPAYNPAVLLAFLKEFITAERWEKFNQVLAFRTRYITVVLEDIYQSQNASAVLRSCDLTGIQDVHIIENRNIYDVNPDVALGSNKWINLIKYNEQQDNTLLAYESLRAKGYTIVATSPGKMDHTPETQPLDKPIALVFGSELRGLTPIALANADSFLRIPMFGFTESFNISVSAALILHSLTQRLRQSDNAWQLSDMERTITLLNWCRRSIRNIDKLEKEFFSRI